MKELNALEMNWTDESVKRPYTRLLAQARRVITLERELATAERSGESVAEDASECIVALDKATARIAELEQQLSARGHITELPAEFAALAEFYQVDDMPALIRIQAEHVERLQKKLPPLRGPESDPQNYRQG